MIKSVYIHIPFCKSICSYCDFCKQLYNETNVKKYLSSLREEINDRYNDEELDTLYIGGGTPTILSERELSELLETISSQIEVNKLEEFTLEAGRPDTITAEKFAILHKFKFVSTGKYEALENTPASTDGIKPDGDKTKQPAASSKNSLKIAIIIAVAVVMIIIISIVFIIVAVAIKNNSAVSPEQLLGSLSDELNIDNSNADLE